MSCPVILPPFNPAAPFPAASAQPAYDFSQRLAPEIILPALAQCRLPKKDEVFQVLAGDEWVSPPLRLTLSRRQFVLLPPNSVARGRVMVLRVAVTPLAAIILWPTVTERDAGHQSQQAVLEAAEQGWVRFWKERGEYRHARVMLDHTPAYPTVPLEVLAEQAGLRPGGREACHDRA
jgi:hypothetical protein